MRKIWMTKALCERTAVRLRSLRTTKNAKIAVLMINSCSASGGLPAAKNRYNSPHGAA